MISQNGRGTVMCGMKISFKKWFMPKRRGRESKIKKRERECWAVCLE